MDPIFSYDVSQIQSWTGWSREKAISWRKVWNETLIACVSRNRSTTTIECHRLLEDIRESMPTQAARNYRRTLTEVEDNMTEITSEYTGNIIKVKENTEYFPTGIPGIDEALGGAQKRQLWVHASRHHSRHMIMMWAYQHALNGGRSLIISQDELPKFFRKGILDLHAFHPKFKALSHPKFPGSYSEAMQNHILPDWEKNCGDVMYCNTLNLDHGGELLRFGVPLVFIDNFLQPGMLGDHCRKKTEVIAHYAKAFDIAIVATLDYYNPGTQHEEVHRTADVVTSCTSGIAAEEATGDWADFTFRCMKARDVAPFDPFSTPIPEWGFIQE